MQTLDTPPADLRPSRRSPASSREWRFSRSILLALATGCALAVIASCSSDATTSPSRESSDQSRGTEPASIAEHAETQDSAPSEPTTEVVEVTDTDIIDAAPGDTTSDSADQVLAGDLTGDPVDKSGALVFDGTDDTVAVGTLDVVGSGLTLEAWIRPDGFQNCSSQDCRVISKAAGTSNADHWWMLSTIEVDDDIRLRFRAKIDGKTQTLVAQRGHLAIGEWVHAAATFDGSTMALFVDGELVGSQSVTSGSLSVDPEVEVWIGSNPPKIGSRPWQGAIDEVRIWNHARSTDQIAEFADRELEGMHLGLVGYWRFNSPDQVSTDHTGTHQSRLGQTDTTDSSDPTLTTDRLPPPPDPPKNQATADSYADAPVDEPAAGPTAAHTDTSTNGLAGSTSPKPDASTVGPRVAVTRTISASQALDELRSTGYLSQVRILGGLTLSGSDGIGWIIEDSIIEGDGRFALRAYTSGASDFTGTAEQRAIFRHVTIVGAAPRGGSTSAVVYGRDLTIEHADIYGGIDGVKASGRFTLRNSWIHDLDHPDGAHADAIQIRSGTDMLFIGNRIDAYIGYSSDNSYDKVGGTANGALQTGSVTGPIEATWQNNYFAGGHYTMRGSESPGVDYTWTNNTWMRHGTSVALNSTSLAPSRWGPALDLTLDATNVWEDSGLPVDG